MYRLHSKQQYCILKVTAQNRGEPDVHFLAVSPTDSLDSVSFHGPRWRMEPGDLFIPVDTMEEEATLTCDAKGVPPPQYR